MSFVEKLTRGIADGQIKYWQHILSCNECFKKHMEIIKHGGEQGTGFSNIVETIDKMAEDMGMKL